MNQPPANVSPSELFRRLTEMPRPHTTFRYPRKDPATRDLVEIEVAIWVLTESELQSARASAELYAQDLLKGNPNKLPTVAVVDGAAEAFRRGSVGYEEIYRNEMVVECVVRAVRDPKNLRLAFFPNAQLARKHCTSDEFAALFEAYCAWQAESGPLVGEMDPETQDAWIARLEEGGSGVPLALLSSVAQSRLLMRLISDRRKSREGSTSSGLPAGGSSSASDPSPSELVTPPAERLGDDERPSE